MENNSENDNIFIDETEPQVSEIKITEDDESGDSFEIVISFDKNNNNI